jgi:hypothetical protein
MFLLQINDDGYHKEVIDKNIEFGINESFILINSGKNKFYVWIGKHSSVRKEFLAFTEARKIIDDTNFEMIRVQEETKEKVFNKLLIRWKKQGVGKEEGIVLQHAKKYKIKSDEHIPDIISKVWTILEVIEECKKMPIIENHCLDYIIVNEQIYAISIEDQWEHKLVREVTDGIFEVDIYKSRFYLKNDKLVAIELWRKLKDSNSE